VAHRLICEAVDELGLQNKVIGIAPVGCSVLMHQYMDLDFVEAPHGRAPALASGMKAVRPEKVIFTYQGDGDLASIGMSEIIHTMNRALPLTIIFINNAIYGMTGGQMAPTTLIGQKSTTSPAGRTAKANGYPIRMCELLATLEGPAYIERVALTQPKYVMKAKQAVLKAFKNQAEGKGLSFVELLSTCPTNWGLRPTDSCKWLEENMIPYYPLGVFKDLGSGESGSPKH